jgi:hypothetical protein
MMLVAGERGDAGTVGAPASADDRSAG